MAEREGGLVITYDSGKRFGYIRPDDRDCLDAYFHSSEFKLGEPAPAVGQRVTYTAVASTRKPGRLVAVGIEVEESSSEREVGVIKVWLDTRACGFIKPDDGGPDVWVHRSTLARDPVVGEVVNFVVRAGPQGLVAFDVRQENQT